MLLYLFVGGFGYKTILLYSNIIIQERFHQKKYTKLLNEHNLIQYFINTGAQIVN